MLQHKVGLHKVRRRRTFKHHLLLTSAAIVSSALAGSVSASAQTAPAVAQAPSVEEIVVTGTRIIRNGYEAPTPLTVINPEEIARLAPTNIADYVNQMPELSKSITGHNSGYNVSAGAGGLSSLNLRALNANRTLVLLDGMRLVSASISSGYGGAVDTNSLPDSLVSRVDVVTGGASAAYGSDALAGVVNFILDKTFTGVKGTVQGGVTTYGDDRQYLVSLAAGTGFAGDRGHFLISGQTTHNDGILLPTNRAFINEAWQRLINPAYTATNGQPYYLMEPHVGTSSQTPGGLINGGPLKGIDFGPGGVPRQFVYGSINDGFAMSGGDWAETPVSNYGYASPYTSLDTQGARHNLFTRASFDVTDDVQVFLQYMYSINNTLGYCCANSRAITIQSGNPFIPASVQAQMTALKITSFPLQQYVNDLGIAADQNSRQMGQYAVGASGKFDALQTRWSWDAYIERSASRISAKGINDMIQANYDLATNAVRNPATGAIVCASTLTNPNNGCVPFNPMGVGVNSTAALAYLTGESHLSQKLRQDVASATLRGEPFSSWAGPVSLAIGLEHRRESVTSAITALDAAKAFSFGNYSATFGSYHVNEGSIEAVIPLAKDMAWAKALDLNAAFRETGYSTSGNVTTWKIGLSYAPYADLRFRATQSRDIRAPNMGEAFNAGQSVSATVFDDFKGIRVPYRGFTIGNPALAPEKADTTGAGVVYQPSWLPGFSTSFDYFNIDISNVITAIAGQTIIDVCYAGNTLFCPFITRDAGGNITVVTSQPVNAATASTHGFDIEASYSKRLSDLVDSWNGTVSARLLATRVLGMQSTTADGVVVSGLGVFSTSGTVSRWREHISLTYDNDDFSVSWTAHAISSGTLYAQYIQCTSGCPKAVPPDYTINNNYEPGEFAMNMNFTYHVKTEGSLQYDFFLSVDNIANWEPPAWANTANAPYSYDEMGRIFRAGIRFKM